MRLHLKKPVPCILPILLDRWSSGRRQRANGWKSSEVRDCAFYPDKKKGPGAVVNGQELCRIAGRAGHWRDKVLTLVRKIPLWEQWPQDAFFFLR